MLEFIEEKKHKATKDHECELCKRKIEKGGTYWKTSGKYEGEFFRYKLHDKCKRMVRRFMDETGETEWSPEDIEELAREYVCQGRCGESNSERECDVFDCYTVELWSRGEI